MLDSTNDTLRQVLHPTTDSLKIYSDGNESYRSGDSSVIAKVTFGGGKGKNPVDKCIIEFDKNST